MAYTFFKVSKGFTIDGYAERFIFDILHVDFTYLAIVSTIGGIWDVINDTLIGALVDKTRTRWGKFKPYLFTFAIPGTIGACLFWMMPLFFPGKDALDLSKFLVYFALAVARETAGTFSEISQTGMLLNKNLYSLSDGEMPWGSDQTVTEIYYRLLLGQVKGYSLTSMSIAHNYREGADYWLKRWQSQPLFEKDLKKMKLPFNPAMLEGGQVCVFEYLQYHLGYQLGVSNLKVRKGKLSFLINNFGLDAPHEFELYYVVDGKEIPAPGYDPMELSRFGQLAVEYDLSGAASFGLIFRHRRWGDLTIKLANDLPYENGVNIIIG